MPPAGTPKVHYSNSTYSRPISVTVTLEDVASSMLVFAAVQSVRYGLMMLKQVSGRPIIVSSRTYNSPLIVQAHEDLRRLSKPFCLLSEELSSSAHEGSTVVIRSPAGT